MNYSNVYFRYFVLGCIQEFRFPPLHQPPPRPASCAAPSATPLSDNFNYSPSDIWVTCQNEGGIQNTIKTLVVDRWDHTSCDKEFSGRGPGLEKLISKTSIHNPSKLYSSETWNNTHTVSGLRVRSPQDHPDWVQGWESVCWWGVQKFNRKCQ